MTTYLGLTEAQRHRGPIDWLGNVTDRVHEFLELHEDAAAAPSIRASSSYSSRRWTHLIPPSNAPCTGSSASLPASAPPGDST